MTLTLVEGDRFNQMERVAELTLEGMTPNAISKKLDISRKEVVQLQDDYRTVLSKDSEARDLARDHLNMMVKHYDKLIAKSYELIEEIETLSFSHQVAAQKNAAIKLVADLDAKRLDALQKAGLLDSAELGDELADMEAKQNILIDILRNDLCPICRANVAYKLSQVTESAEVVEVEVV